MELNSFQKSKQETSYKIQGASEKYGDPCSKNWEFQDGNQRPFNQVLNLPDYEALYLHRSPFQGATLPQICMLARAPVWNWYARNRIRALDISFSKCLWSSKYLSVTPLYQIPLVFNIRMITAQERGKERKFSQSQTMPVSFSSSGSGGQCISLMY